MGHDNYIHGDWNAICDRCGFKYKASQLKEEWTGLMVCSGPNTNGCWEPRHPQDFLRGIPDDPSVPWTRPDSNADTNTTDVNGGTIQSDQTVEVYGNESPTYTWGASVMNVIEFNTTLTRNRTLTLAGNPSARDRLTVYRTAGGAYTLDVGGIRTIPASVTAVVVLEFDGSAWQEISYTTLGL